MGTAIMAAVGILLVCYAMLARRAAQRSDPTCPCPLCNTKEPTS